MVRVFERLALRVKWICCFAFDVGERGVLERVIERVIVKMKMYESLCCFVDLCLDV